MTLNGQVRIRDREGTTIRRLLIAVFVLGAVGTGAELILLEHTDDIWQWTPLILLGVSQKRTHERTSFVLSADELEGPEEGDTASESGQWLRRQSSLVGLESTNDDLGVTA